jgi:hypothetical protein
MIQEKITFRPGLLAKPMSIKIKVTGETPSKYLRRLVAEDCGKPVPKMLVGNPEFRKKKKRSKGRSKSCS